MRKSLFLAAAASVAAFATPAAACDPVPGMLIGGGIGAAIGNAPGAAVGAILGSAITGGAPCYHRYDDRYYDGPYVERRYSAPVYYDGAPVHYAPPARVYYAPPPVYYSPVVYRSYPAYPVVYVSYARPYYRGHRHGRYWR